MGLGRVRWVMWLVFALGISARAAQAEPAADAADADEAQAERSKHDARRAFRLGAALARQGQWTEALAAFERSEQLHPHATTAYNIAFAERALGRFTRARRAFRQALDRNGAAAQPELSERVAKRAMGYLKEVERRIVAVRVQSREPDLRVLVDGRPLETERSGADPVLVAGTRAVGPGERLGAARFVLMADPGNRVIELRRGDRTRVLHVGFDSARPEALVLEIAEPLPGARAPEPTDPTWTILAFGIGAAGFAVGGVAGVAALNEKASLNDHCDENNRCPPQYQGDLDSLNRNAAISTMGFGIGIAGAVTGAVLLLSGGRAREPTPAARGIRPWLAASGVGLEGTY